MGGGCSFSLADDAEVFVSVEEKDRVTSTKDVSKAVVREVGIVILKYCRC